MFELLILRPIFLVVQNGNKYHRVRVIRKQQLVCLGKGNFIINNAKMYVTCFSKRTALHYLRESGIHKIR